MSHIWVIERKVDGEWWGWEHNIQLYSRDLIKEKLKEEKSIFPNYKFRIKKYIREDE